MNLPAFAVTGSQGPSHDIASNERGRVLDRLQAAQAQIEPAYFYDALGSTLFDAISLLEEYTPPRCEAAIFKHHGHAIVAASIRLLGKRPVLIDLGAGNGRKAAGLFADLQPEQYVAVDVSETYLRQSLLALQADYPQQDMLGVVQNFAGGLRFDSADIASRIARGPRLFFYPGSSIGNFEPEAAAQFLASLRRAAGDEPSGLLIGVDLVKPVAVLEAAYDDPVGVTAAFNKNVLRHLAHKFGIESRLEDWAHRAFFNAPMQRIEMHLEAIRPTELRAADWQRRFDTGQSIHTEISCKYTPESFSQVLVNAGLQVQAVWTDPKGWFAVFLAA